MMELQDQYKYTFELAKNSRGFTYVIKVKGNELQETFESLEASIKALKSKVTELEQLEGVAHE